MIGRARGLPDTNTVSVRPADPKGSEEVEYERNKPIAFEKLNKRVDDLETKLAWQMEKTSRLAGALREVVDNLARVEAQQKEYLASQQKTLGAEVSQDKLQQLLNTLKHYSGMAETGGQILQTLAAAAVLIIDNIARGRESALASGTGQTGDLDLAALLKAANELLRGLGAQGSGETSARTE